MPVDNRCPRCGAARPSGAPGGLCPQCLLRLGLGHDLSDRPGPGGATEAGGSASRAGGRECDVTRTLTGPPGAPRAPLLTALDEAIGPIHRVLLRDTPTDDPKPVRPRSEEMPD
jgi:hypothetical protein